MRNKELPNASSVGKIKNNYNNCRISRFAKKKLTEPAPRAPLTKKRRNPVSRLPPELGSKLLFLKRKNIKLKQEID